MTNAQCDIIVGQVIGQLGPQFRAEVRNRTCQIVTPFLYPDNTPITVTVAPVNDNRVLLSDSGEAADFAFVNGVGATTLRERLGKVERRFQLDTGGQELSVEADVNDLGRAMSTVINGIQDVGYLVYRRASRRPSVRFHDEVERYLVDGRHPYESKVTIAGATGSRTMDYRVSGTDGMHQLYLKTFEPTSTASTLARAKVVAFDVRDILAALNSDPLRIAVLIDDRNDRLATPFGNETRLILNSGGAEVIAWDDRARIEDLIAA